MKTNTRDISLAYYLLFAFEHIFQVLPIVNRFLIDIPLVLKEFIIRNITITFRK